MLDAKQLASCSLLINLFIFSYEMLAVVQVSLFECVGSRKSQLYICF